MKKIKGLFAIIAVVLLCSSCDPLETRQELKGATTMDKINSLVSVSAEVRNGKRSNYLLLKSDGLDALSSFDYGLGTYVGTNGRVQVVSRGDNTVVFTALNADGTKLSKEFTVNVEELYDVAPEWEMFCGNGSKVWTWDEQASAVWGNGGYLGNTAPGWWTVAAGDMDGQTPGEGAGATMTFSVKGSALVKNKTNGSAEEGSFAFDMSKQTLADGNIWAIGKLSTKGVSVLSGKQPNHGGGPVNEYDILKLTNTEMVLAWPEPGAGAWGTAWFWLFRAK
ncbi:MAG: hypothetical protein LBD21_10420 [Tannerellaceae bacterium]|jgi:hypothetical protein|nr:hypothetical protein [Tannerellaceae bacterium]